MTNEMTPKEAVKILKGAIKQPNTEDGYIGQALTMGIKAIEEQQWIPVSERLPMCEQEVLICAERRSISGKIKTIITTAIYEDGTMLENKSKWDWTDIDWERWDEEDCGVIPEGWWEYRHYNPDEVYNNLVDDFIIAWMPLPEPYKSESEEE